MTIYLATDHAGFALKEKVKTFLENAGYAVGDMGAYTEDLNDDYPDFITVAAQAVANDLIRGIDSKGIIFGGSGQGEAMAANRVDGVRAAVYYGGPTDIITLSRQHNDANVLSLGARFISEDAAITAVKLWLETQFSNEERHKRRILKF